MIITNDASRFRITICIAKKGEASPTLILQAKTFKNHTRYYLIEWRFDNGTEFLHFQKWAKEKNLTVSPSSAYAHKQNSVAEFSGHYVMQIARTIYIDGGAPKELQTEACYTATYIINRLIRHGEEAPILAQRKAIGLRGDDTTTNLSFLRVQYSKAYVHQAKETRVQGMKIDPRVQIGFLVSYKGDNRHCFRIYNPKTKKVIVYRDVVFQEPKAPKTYNGAADFQIGESVDDKVTLKTQFKLGKALFKTARQAAKDLGSTDTGQHVSSGEEHRFTGVEEETSFNSDDVEMFYNTETIYNIQEARNTLEDRV